MAEQDHGQDTVEVVVAGARPDVGERLGEIWWAFMLRGIFALALGLFALFWPNLSLSVLVLIVGVVCIADGLASLAAAMHAYDRRGYVAQALVSLGIGAILMFWPEGALRALLMLFGAWILFMGINHFMAARQVPAAHPDRALVMATAIIGAIVGAVLILWPGSGVVTISWLIGLAALLVGGLMVYLALRLKRLDRTIHRGA